MFSNVLRFDYLDDSLQERAIFRYRVVGESTQDFLGNSASSGYAWVDVSRSYTATAGTGTSFDHDVDFYWEQIPGFDLDDDYLPAQSPIKMLFNDSSLLRGWGSTFFEGVGNVSRNGLVVEGASVCLSAPCYYRAQMSLLGLNYSQSGGLLVLEDGVSPVTSSLLFEQESMGPFFDINSNMVHVSGANLLACDVNQDGAVNFLDIAPFVALLSSNTFQAEADCNFDGQVNFFDIAPFIAVLSN